LEVRGARMPLSDVMMLVSLLDEEWSLWLVFGLVAG